MRWWGSSGASGRVALPYGWPALVCRGCWGTYALGMPRRDKQPDPAAASRRGPKSGRSKPSNAELERRWVDAWNDLLDLTRDHPKIRCVLPDGTDVNVEACMGWLQESAYAGFTLSVGRGWHLGRRAVVVGRAAEPS